MRYLLLLYGEPVRPETLTPEQWQGVVEAHTTFHRELTYAGALVDSSPAAPPTEARTLRTRSGEQLVMDGPFAETKEVLGGYYLIEAESLDAAWNGRSSSATKPRLDRGATGCSSSVSIPGRPVRHRGVNDPQRRDPCSICS